MCRALLTFFLFLLASGGIAALGRAELRSDSTDQAARQLDQLRREIQETERRLQESRHREKDLLTELNDFDREISLRTELIGKLKTEQKKAEKALENSQRELQAIQGNLQRTRSDSQFTAQEQAALCDLVKRRALYTYKHFHRDVITAFLTSGSLNQWLVRQEYLRRLSEADGRNLLQLGQKNAGLASISQQLSQRESDEASRLKKYQESVAYRARLVAEGDREATRLKQRRGDRTALLKRLRQDRELLAQQLEEKKQAATRVEALIKSLETKREKTPLQSARPELSPALPFAQLRGRLPWPASGKVVARFGLQRHEKLATVTENPGIDIAAEEGTPVASVSSGEVTKVTWLRGYGNTVIVDHRDGYYTVYAHLDQIQVRESQFVKTGDLIGQVGQTGSISGPRLHFEIWAKREKQNPLDWLAAK